MIMAALGVPVSTIRSVLNHAEGGVTKIYNRFGRSGSGNLNNGDKWIFSL